MIRGLYLRLLTLFLKANPDTVVAVIKKHSCRFFWGGHVYSSGPMLGEQLRQTLARLGYLCSARKIKKRAFHQPEFRALFPLEPQTRKTLHSTSCHND